jgi:hypothetical protein
MTDKSGLAAVAAAADSVSKADHEAAVLAAREEGHKAGLAEGETAGHSKGHAEGLVAGKAEGEAVGRAAGVIAERDRILGIEALGLKGHEKLVAELKADGKTSPAEAAIQILKAEKETGGRVLAGLAADGATGALAAAAAQPSGGAAPNSAALLADQAKPIEERCKAAFDADPALRAEFGKVETLVAYQRAHETGVAKVFRK